MVPIRCIISTGTVEDTTVADPLLPVSDIELMFMKKASIQSDGASPIFTWIGVFWAVTGGGVVEVPLAPPHAASAAVKTVAKMATATVHRFEISKE
jgi:hypothetical protein